MVGFDNRERSLCGAAAMRETRRDTVELIMVLSERSTEEGLMLYAGGAFVLQGQKKQER